MEAKDAQRLAEVVGWRRLAPADAAEKVLPQTAHIEEGISVQLEIEHRAGHVTQK